ncbi:transcriptional regulator, partial [Oenococcus oeni]
LTDDGVSRGRKFSALISESSAMLEAGDNLFSSMCAMKNGMVLNHLLEELELSKKDIEIMIGTLEKKLPNAAKEVACNCLPGEEGDCK